MNIRSSLVFAIAFLHGCAAVQPQPAPEEPPPPQKVEPQFEFTLFAPSNVQDQIAGWIEQEAWRADLRIKRAEVGYYLDVQEAQLQQLRDDNFALFREGDSILLRITGGFGTNSSRLNPAVERVLGSISVVLSEFRKTLVIVNCHTDTTGSPGYNRWLSEQRAIAVARFFVEHGVPADRIAAVGRGESSPLNSPEASQGEWPNRRIDIRLVLIVEEAP